MSSLSPELLNNIFSRYSGERSELIPILQDVQGVIGYIPREAMTAIAAFLGMAESTVYGVVTFYAQFRLQPLGKHLIKVCHGTACHLCGAEMVADTLAQATGAKEGETSEDKMFTVERVACLGCCSLAPCIMIDSETHGRLIPEAIGKVINEVRKQEEPTPAG